MMDSEGCSQTNHWRHFKVLLREWREDPTVMLTSSATQAVKHSACRKIISMGMLAVPYIIEEIRDKPDPFWPAVLWNIVGENSMFLPKEHQGKVKLICEDWVRWWDEKQEGGLNDETFRRH